MSYYLCIWALGVIIAEHSFVMLRDVITGFIPAVSG